MRALAPIVAILAWLAMMATTSCGVSPAFAQNSQVSGLPARGPPAASDQVPVLPAGASHLQAITVGAIAALSGVATLNSFAGVDPTGVTDSPAAIQAALNTGQSLTCAGIYKISPTIYLTSPVNNGQRLIGSGQGSAESTTTAGRCIFVPVSTFTGPVFSIDGAPNGTYITGWKLADFSIDLSNVPDNKGVVGINVGQAFDGAFEGVRVTGDLPSNLTSRTTTAASGTGTTATLTFTPPVTYTVGQVINVAGVTPSGYNGAYEVTASSAGSVSYANTATGSQAVAGTVTGTKDSWRTNAYAAPGGGTYTTTWITTQGQMLYLTGYYFNSSTTTLVIINHDGFQVFGRYLDGAKFIGGAYQGAGWHFTLNNSNAIDLDRVDAEGSGMYLTITGYSQYIRSHALLGGMATGFTELNGSCSVDCEIWNSTAASSNYAKSLTGGGFVFNSQASNGNSQFYSGSVSNDYSVEFGRVANDWLMGVAGASNDFIPGSSAGDAVIEGLTSTGNI